MATSTGSSIARDGIHAVRDTDTGTDIETDTDTGVRTGDGRIRAITTTITHHPRITIAASTDPIAIATTGEPTQRSWNRPRALARRPNAG